MRSVGTRAGLWLVLVLVGLARPATAIIEKSSGPYTTVYLGQTQADLEDPLNGDTVEGFSLCRFRDADEIQIDTGRFKRWTGTGTTIDGSATEVWLRNSGTSLSTETTVPSTVVSIHLAGDDNDGQAQVSVDGSVKAVLDMCTTGSADYALVIVENLSNTTHTITVEDLGETAQTSGDCETTSYVDDDVAILGAAAVTGQCPAGISLITHGFTFSAGEWCGDISPPTGCTPPAPGAWVESMAKAIIQEAGGDCEAASPVGAVLKYQPATGEWTRICGSQNAGEEVVLIFNWAEESDGINQGGTYGYAEAAADALYGALRDPVFDGFPASFDPLDTSRSIHFIGHSRGTVVNSAVLRRLGRASFNIAQVTLLDGHPVDGNPPPDWGDPQPRVWTTLSWADSYARSDADNPLDFQGEASIDGADDESLQARLGDDDVGDVDPPYEHVEVHAWYHGTIDLEAIDDGDSTTIDDGTTARSGSWYATDGADEGYAYSPYGGGSRPSVSGPAQAPSHNPLHIYNGDFEITEAPPGNSLLGHAGWRYHGGDVGLFTTWAHDATRGSNYAQLDSSHTSLTHNRLYIDADVRSLQLEHRVRLVDGNDKLQLLLIPPGGGSAVPVGEKTLTNTLGWKVLHFPIPADRRGQTYAFKLEIQDAGATGVQVDLDDLVFVGERPVPALSGRNLATLLLFLVVSGTALLAWRRLRAA